MEIRGRKKNRRCKFNEYSESRKNWPIKLKKNKIREIRISLVSLLLIIIIMRDFSDKFFFFRTLLNEYTYGDVKRFTSIITRLKKFFSRIYYWKKKKKKIKRTRKMREKELKIRVFRCLSIIAIFQLIFR